MKIDIKTDYYTDGDNAIKEVHTVKIEYLAPDNVTVTKEARFENDIDRMLTFITTNKNDHES